MPFRRRTFGRRRIFARRRAPRRKFKRRFVNPRKRATRSRTGGPVGNADRKFVKLKYTLDSTVVHGTSGDPTPIGINPTANLLEFGFDGTAMLYPPVGIREWAAFYRRVRVHGVKVQQAVTQMADNIPFVWRTCFTNTTFSGTDTDFDRVGGQAYSRRRLISGQDVRVANMKQYMSTKKIQGISRLDDTFFNDLSSAGVITSETSRSAFYYTVADTPATPDAPQAMLTSTTITYYLEFADRRALESGAV